MEYIIQSYSQEHGEWENDGNKHNKGVALKLFSDAVFHQGDQIEFRVWNSVQNVTLVANTPRGFEVGE